jgi:hypothetical protein
VQPAGEAGAELPDHGELLVERGQGGELGRRVRRGGGAAALADVVELPWQLQDLLILREVAGQDDPPLEPGRAQPQDLGPEHGVAERHGERLGQHRGGRLAVGVKVI